MIFANYLNGISLMQTARQLKAQGFNVTSALVRYALENVVYTGDVLLQKYFTPNHRTNKFIRNTGQLPQYYVENNHPAIIDRATFAKVQELIKENREFNPAAPRIFKPSCFTAKIVCGLCGAHFVKTTANLNDGDSVRDIWICCSKAKKGAGRCAAKNIRGSKLRKLCCEILGWKEFDGAAFGKIVSQIVTTATDILEFHLIDGTVAKGQISYFSRYERKYKDPDIKRYGYRWDGSQYVIVPDEAEAVKLIYGYYADGWTLTGISRQMEAAGYKSSGGKMSSKFLATLLDNVFYIGHRPVKARYTASGEDELIPNDHEAIIDNELFHIVQKRRAVEKKKREQRVLTRRRNYLEKRNRDTGQHQ